MTDNEPIVPDLAAAIIKFAESLPKTISSDILHFVLIYATDFTDVTADVEAMLSKAKETLSAEDWLAQMGAVCRFIGAFDHVLWRAFRMSPLAKKSNEELAGRMPEQYA